MYIMNWKIPRVSRYRLPICCYKHKHQMAVNVTIYYLFSFYSLHARGTAAWTHQWVCHLSQKQNAYLELSDFLDKYSALTRCIWDRSNVKQHQGFQFTTL
jgi:hypothetical protein